MVSSGTAWTPRPAGPIPAPGGLLASLQPGADFLSPFHSP